MLYKGRERERLFSKVLKQMYLQRSQFHVAFYDHLLSLVKSKNVFL